MGRDYDDSWLPPLEDEGEGFGEELASEGLDSSQPVRQSRARRLNIGPTARRVGGVLLIVLVGVAVWWGVQQLLLPPPAVPVPTGEWSPPTAEAPDSEATATPADEVQDPDATAEATGIEEGGSGFDPGQTVLVTGTDGEGIRFRSDAGTDSVTLVILEEGAQLTVLDGPDVADGYTWWHLETADGTSGWAAEDWLTAAGAP